MENLMIVKYHQAVTRPSLDHIFYMEKEIAGFNKLLGENTIPVKLSTGEVPITRTYAEHITWAEIIARIDELRPDIRDWMEMIGLDQFVSDTESWGNGPVWNPLALTWNVCSVFQSEEDAIHAYTAYTPEKIAEIQGVLAESSNTLVDSFTDEHGNPITTIETKFK